MTMLLDWLALYWLFVLKLTTSLLVVGGFVLLILAMIRRQRSPQHIAQPEWELFITPLHVDFNDYQAAIMSEVADRRSLRRFLRNQKSANLAKNKSRTKPGRIFVLDFEGSEDANETRTLKEEITALVMMAEKNDEVVLRLHSPGGTVNGYGHAASQLMRLKEKGIPLTVIVSEVAASGGYMMACVADKLIAAPFAYIGSIGVVSMVPNVHRLLKRNLVDVQYFTAGRYKRTVTPFGEITEEGAAKHREELEQIHKQFMSWVETQRPSLDIEAVATGEFWLGQEALKLGLIDEIGTSEAYLLKAFQDGKRLYHIKYYLKEKLQGKLEKLYSRVSALFRPTLR